MKYFASFTANNGNTWNREPYEFSNKQEAIKTIKEIAKGNHFCASGNESTYRVWDENDICIAAGTLLGFRQQWQVDKEKIGEQI